MKFLKDIEEGWGWWLFRKGAKGTAAEPWPTAEELWNDKNVQKSIKRHNEFTRKKMKEIEDKNEND